MFTYTDTYWYTHTRTRRHAGCRESRLDHPVQHGTYGRRKHTHTHTHNSSQVHTVTVPSFPRHLRWKQLCLLWALTEQSGRPQGVCRTGGKGQRQGRQTSGYQVHSATRSRIWALQTCLLRTWEAVFRLCATGTRLQRTGVSALGQPLCYSWPTPSSCSRPSQDLERCEWTSQHSPAWTRPPQWSFRSLRFWPEFGYLHMVEM